MKSLLLDIWQSFRSLPGWVQFWVGSILVPINLFPIVFWDHPDSGFLIATLAIGGMLPNIGIMIAERGFSKSMAISHLFLFTNTAPLDSVQNIPPKGSKTPR